MIEEHADIKEYQYELPECRIAQFPLNKREDSKLLYYKNSSITDTYFKELPSYLEETGMLILNNSKVIYARLIFKKTTGAEIEIFCLEPYQPLEYLNNLQSNQKCLWKCLIGNGKKWKEASITSIIKIENTEYKLTATKEKSVGKEWIISFNWDAPVCFAEILVASGKIPIPPYLNRDSESIDKERYQTIYAQREGSVAAPTAGLHFTPSMIDQINQLGIQTEYLTLHVGAGTFLPVKTDNIYQHTMHQEFISVERKVVENILKNRKKTCAVGTTSLRTIESLYWLGVKIHTHSIDNNNKYLEIKQFEYRELEQNISKELALSAILKYLDIHQKEAIEAHTQMMIIKGYQFRICDQLITNFHQPGSTLLLIIAAICGNDWRKIYNYALDNEYRFLSYGDSSLLEIR